MEYYKDINNIVNDMLSIGKEKKTDIEETDYLYHCKGCGKPDKDNQRVKPITYHMWARADAYGIYTGLYCDKCYEDPQKYTYKKDRYHDEAYCGERMNPDE